jgi:hypothetical protein
VRSACDGWTWDAHVVGEGWGDKEGTNGGGGEHMGGWREI